jgi:hypothetical protein
MKKVISISLAIILALAGCTTSTRMMSSGQFAELKFAPLTKDQYTILKDVDGTGTASSFLIFGAKDCAGRAKNAAMYEAIGKIPGADLLIAPRYEIEKYTFLFIYKRVSVKVKAKAIE